MKNNTNVKGKINEENMNFNINEKKKKN